MSNKMFFAPSGAGGYLDKLVGYYKFDSNANDFSGKNHHGTINGSPTFSTGKVGNAIDFINDTNPNYVTVPHTNDFNFSNGVSDIPFSLSMWVKFHSFNSANRFFSKAVVVSGTFSGYHFGFQGTLYISKINNSVPFIYRLIQSVTNPFTLNTWHHVSYTDSGIIGEEKLHVDGIPISVTRTTFGGDYVTMGTNTVESSFATPNWALGNNINKHKGLIDETYIWKNRELTPTEILDIYNKGLAGISLI